MKAVVSGALTGLALLTTLSCSDDSVLPTDPVAQPGLTTTALATVSFRQISTGFGPPCAIASDYRAYCWTNGTDAAAVPVPGNKLFRSVTVGGNGFFCGIVRPGDRVYCWGHNSDGALGDGTTDDHPE